MIECSHESAPSVDRHRPWSGHPDLYWDDCPLVDELATRAIIAKAAVWTDDSIEWAADLVLVKSCWDAHRTRDGS